MSRKVPPWGLGKGSRKIRLECTYIRSSLVGVYVTSTQADSSTINAEASTLPNAEHGKCLGRFPHGGDGGKFREGSESNHLLAVGCSRKEVHATAHTHASKSRGKLHGNFPHGGDGGRFKESSDGKHLLR